MKDKVWEVKYEGHLIKAINKLSYFPPKTGEVLEIDGNLVNQVKSSFFQMTSTIIQKYSFDGIEREVEVRIAQKTGSFGTGCQIFIDGEQIGGDKNIQYPDPEEIKQVLGKGFFKYFLKKGLLNFGLPYAVIMAIFYKHDPINIMVWKFVFHALFFGLFMAFFYWRNIKSMHDKNKKP